MINESEPVDDELFATMPPEMVEFLKRRAEEAKRKPGIPLEEARRRSMLRFQELEATTASAQES